MHNHISIHEIRIGTVDDGKSQETTFMPYAVCDRLDNNRRDMRAFANCGIGMRAKSREEMSGK